MGKKHTPWNRIIWKFIEFVCVSVWFMLIECGQPFAWWNIGHCVFWLLGNTLNIIDDRMTSFANTYLMDWKLISLTLSEKKKQNKAQFPRIGFGVSSVDIIPLFARGSLCGYFAFKYIKFNVSFSQNPFISFHYFGFWKLATHYLANINNQLPWLLRHGKTCVGVLLPNSFVIMREVWK